VRGRAGPASAGAVALGVVVGFIWWGGGSRAGISSTPATSDPSRATVSIVPTRSPSDAPASRSEPTPHQGAIDAAAARGLEVWIDVDLAQRWLEGPETFATTVMKLAPLARRPGVVGFKIADELGYQDGFEAAWQVRAFLESAATALRRIAPDKQIMVDLLVPELGCAPGILSIVSTSSLCAQQLRARYPALTLTSVDGYIRSGLIDVVDLSTDLLSEATYATWGITSAQAQRAAWQEVNILHWPRRVTLHERHSLAHPGTYAGTSADAQRDADLYAWIPLSLGASGVDVWAWQQPEGAVMMRLMDPGLRPNALWRMLIGLRRQGVELYTSFSPTWTDRGVSQDMRELARVFSGVVVAAGV
jgi:hypothetical protein